MERVGMVNLSVLLWDEDRRLVNQLQNSLCEFDIWVPCRINMRDQIVQVDLFPPAMTVLSRFTSKFRGGGRLNVYGPHVKGFHDVDHYSPEMKHYMEYWTKMERNETPGDYYERDRALRQLHQAEELKRHQYMSYANYGMGGMEGMIGRNGFGTYTFTPSYAVPPPDREPEQSKDLDAPMMVTADKEVKPFKLKFDE